MLATTDVTGRALHSQLTRSGLTGIYPWKWHVLHGASADRAPAPAVTGCMGISHQEWLGRLAHASPKAVWEEFQAGGVSTRWHGEVERCERSLARMLVLRTVRNGQT